MIVDVNISPEKENMFIAFICLLGLIQTISAAQSLVFSKSSLSFEDNAGTGYDFQDVTVTLRERPSRYVRIGISTDANMFIAYPCTIRFNSSTWNVPRRIRIRAARRGLAYSANMESTITFAASIQPDQKGFTQCQQFSQDITAVRGIRAPGTCVLSGLPNPPVSTFDGETIGNVRNGVTGDFYMVRAIKHNTEVQVKQGWCTNIEDGHCIDAVAIRHYNTSSVVRVDGEARFDAGSNAVRIQEGDKKLITSSRDGSNYVFTLADGAKVTVIPTFSFSRAKWYLDVKVQLPGFYFNSTQGLCGDFDGKPGNLRELFVVHDNFNLFDDCLAKGVCKWDTIGSTNKQCQIKPAPPTFCIGRSSIAATATGKAASAMPIETAVEIKAKAAAAKKGRTNKPSTNKKTRSAKAKSFGKKGARRGYRSRKVKVNM